MQPDPYQSPEHQQNPHHGGPHHGPSHQGGQQGPAYAPAPTWQPDSVYPPAPAGHHAEAFAQPPSLPEPASAFPATADPLRPIPVVRVLSPVGVEYVFLTIVLFVGAISFASILLLLVNGSVGYESLAGPGAALIVALPVFALIFLHLKRLELKQPELKLDPSKRRSTQFTQIVAFMTCFFTLTTLVFIGFLSMSGDTGVSFGKAALNALIILLVSGGVLAYYWHDEHRNLR